MGIGDIVKKIFSKDEFEEFDTSISAMDGCEGEETISKIKAKLGMEEPC